MGTIKNDRPVLRKLVIAALLALAGCGEAPDVSQDEALDTIESTEESLTRDELAAESERLRAQQRAICTTKCESNLQFQMADCKGKATQELMMCIIKTQACMRSLSGSCDSTCNVNTKCSGPLKKYQSCMSKC